MSNGTVYIPDPVAGPLREWYLRSNKDAELEGPYSYYEAEGKARVSTREAARTGVGDVSLELVQLVGTRQGDPIRPTEVRVICIYLAGRKTSGGSLAQYNSRQGYT